MFSCQVCGREYANRNSLTRHSHNHKKTREHTCLVCQTVFWRKDLLSRHSKMHEQEDSPGSAPNIRVSPSPGTRKRCHTACDECRASRVKCDGQIPCSTCERSGNSCVYGSQSNRISQGPVASRAATGDRTRLPRPQKRPRCSDDTPENDDLDTHSHINQQSSDFPHGSNELASDFYSNDLMTFGIVREPDVPVGANWNPPTNPFYTSSTLDVSLLGESSMNSIGFNSYDPTIAMTTWPSLHEDMFYFEDSGFTWQNPDFNWPVGLSPSGIIDANACGSLHYPEMGNRPIDEFGTEQFHATPAINISEGVTQSQKDKGLLENETRNESNPTSAYLTPDPADLESSAQLPVSRASHQLRIIGELVNHSISLETFRESRASRSAYWRVASAKISEAFVIHNDTKTNDPPHILQHFVDLYLQHFAPLWPLLASHNFNGDSLHPALYLTLTSIGAMYSGRREGHYATMLHERMRRSLLSTALDLDESENDLLWLGQARLLTQVAALYFGQKRAFSCSQYLGGILVSQARRMNLFSAQKHQNACLEDGENDQSSEERLASWMQFEARKRLVFGILRAESYTSVLLSTRPLVSAEEINLELPCTDDIWRKTFPTAKNYLEAARLDRSTGNAPFSDIVRIALDRDEQLPSLEPVGFELLLFGLQSYVWRYSHDPELFRRLTGKDYIAPDQIDKSRPSPPQPGSTSPVADSEPDHLALGTSMNDTTDHLAIPSRKMQSLAHDCDRLFFSLQKWKRSFDTGRTSIHLQKSRGSLLSSLLLFEASFIRLYAPVENLHLISYQLAGKRSTPDSIIKDVVQWTQSPIAEKAVRHACNLWNLIELESKRAEGSPRAQFNFIAFAGLHHAAVVLWAYASNHNEDDVDPLFFGHAADSTDSIRICKENKERLLGTFVRIYKSVSPSRWSSFATAAINLSKAQFPTPSRT